MGMFDVIREGGFIMVPLILCSLAVWAVAFEKFWAINQFRKQFRELHNKAYELLRNGKKEEAKGLYASANPLIAQPHLVLLSDEDLDRDTRNEKILRRLLETQLGLKRFMWVLGTVGSSAPFIGLFGTVVGIIKSFDSIAQTGKSGFSVVAAGLSEALIATAAGIVVAVIAVIFYNYFQTRLNTLNVEFKNQLEDLSDLV